MSAKKTVNKRTSFERIIDIFADHPYISVAAFCVLLFFFGFCERSNLTTGSYIYAGIASALIFSVLILAGKIDRSPAVNAVIFFAACAFSVISLVIIRTVSDSTALMLWLSVCLLASLAAVLKISGNMNTSTFLMLMLAAGIMLRFIYVMYTDSSTRQHDVGYWNWTWGHANYIEYWYNNGLKLPDFDVRDVWQYYHPPLHHMLMALLLKALTLFGMKYDTACQALQILPLMYSSLIPVVSCRIFNRIKLRGLPLIIAMAIVCFHPTFVILAGSFNNDVLSVLLIMLSVLFTLKWYKEPTLKRIIPIALAVGFGMMAKLSAWMAAPAIAVVFLCVFFKNIRSWAKFVGQFALFGIICAPLGLWWQVRNLLMFGVPLTYVPRLENTNIQYCGNISAAQRLFYFGGGQLSYVYPGFTAYGAPYNEYNPTLGLIKTSLFDEGINNISEVNYPQITVTGTVLFWIGAVLALICFAAFIIMMFSRKSGLDALTRVFFSVFAVTMLGSYYLFCFQYPFTCTMNIRYCVPLIPLCAMGLGLLLQRFNGGSLKEKIFRYSSYGLTALFCVMTCVVYTQIS